METKWTLKSGGEATVTVSLTAKSETLACPQILIIATVGGSVVGEGTPQRQRAGSPVFAVMGRLGMSKDIYDQIIATEHAVMAQDTAWVARRAAHDAAMEDYDRCNAAVRKAMSY